MSQTRYINFGDTVLASRINQIATSIVEPGVLSGGEFLVYDNSTLLISPHSVMLDTLLLVESASTLQIIPLTQEAQNYTIAYEHVNQNIQGGAPAQLVLLTGLFPINSLDNTVILGWVKYPGGSVVLDSSFFIEAPKLQVANPTEFEADTLIPPYAQKVYVQSESPQASTVVQTDAYDTVAKKAYMQLSNPSSAPIQTIVHYFPFTSKLNPPSRLLTEAKADFGATLTIELVDEEGTVYAAALNTISNTSGLFTSKEMIVTAVDASKFAVNRPYFVSVTSILNPGSSAYIALVGANSNYLPY